jgi:nicotinamidase-related amidase
MTVINVPTWYYQQFNADYTLAHPAKGYGGWKKQSLPLNLSKTGFVVMHAWDPYNYEQYKGWYKAVEYLPRARKLLDTTFPLLLESLREQNCHIYHVVDEKPLPITSLPQPEKDDIYHELVQFKQEQVFPGKENISDCNKVVRKGMLINENESAVYNSEQLHKCCLNDGVNHLIYSGFAINYCLQYSPGNMNEMNNRGFMCSAFKETVTAVENKESIENELHKEYALWLTAVKNGFVYSLTDFLNALHR